MSEELIVLRLLHIVPGAFWVGASLLVAFIIEPRLYALGPEIARPAIRSIHRVFGPLITLAIIVTIGAGFALVTRTPGRSMDQLFNNDWGWAIGIGVIFGFLSLALGLMTGFIGARISRLDDEAESPEREERIAALFARLSMFGKVASLASVIAIGAMASARFV